MKLALSICAAVALAAVVFAEDKSGESFEDFADKHNKTYDNKIDAKKHETEWEKTHDRLEEHNSTAAGYGVKPSEFDDMLPKEKDKMNGVITENSTELAAGRALGLIWEDLTGKGDPITFERQGSVPSSVDWRPYMNPIRSQGKCGSCYAFASIAVAEGLANVQQRKSIQLSEQHIVDCAQRSQGCLQCNGGTITCGTNFIKSQNGIARLSTYPYSSTTKSYGYPEQCKTVASNGKNAITYSGSYGYSTGCQDINCVKGLLAKGPVIGLVAVNANPKFYNHDGKSYFVCVEGSASKIDHAITVVGYTSQGYIIRNSWDTTWGDKGNGYISYAGDGCGITKNVLQMNIATA